MWNKWGVNIKGCRDNDFEISVVETDYKEGKDSWGLFGEKKLFIAAGDKNSKISVWIWRKLVQLAYDIEIELNRKELDKMLAEMHGSSE